jgi:hypothetical protein
VFIGEHDTSDGEQWLHSGCSRAQQSSTQPLPPGTSDTARQPWKLPDCQATCFPPTPRCEPHHKHTTSCYCFVLSLPHPPILNCDAPDRLHVQLLCLASTTGSTFGLRSARATWTTGASCWGTGGRTAQRCEKEQLLSSSSFFETWLLLSCLHCMRTNARIIGPLH